MVTSGRQNTLRGAFSQTWPNLRVAGWPARPGAAEEAALTRLLLRSVQFREATQLSDIAAASEPAVQRSLR
jgi:hypothetical protein